MATVTFTITETRSTTVEFDVDDDLLADPAERRSANLRAMLTQPAEAVLEGRDVEWSEPRLKITKVNGEIADDPRGYVYVEHAR